MKYCVWLQLVLGTASDFASKLYSKGFTAKQIYENKNILSAISKTLLKKAESVSLSCALEIIEDCNKLGVKIITIEEKDYPKSLLGLLNPPVVLYYKGTFPKFNEIPSICIVGPRKISDYGYKCSYSLSARLALAGFIIVSGGAVGCDYAAHDGALVHEGKTVAILGNGFGADYLKQNETLRNRIEESGCLITEYPPNTPATKFTFPKRNRIMAAISNGTILIEAPRRSGALITSGIAAELGKDVFVIPGSPGNPQYEGSNLLLRDGAKPLVEISDVFSEYLWDYSDKIDIERSNNTELKKPVRDNIGKEKSERTKKKAVIDIKTVEKKPENSKNIKKDKKILSESLSKNANIVYNSLDKQIFCMDDLLNCGLNASEITSALGELEIYGYICGIPGGRYSLK